MNRQRVLLVAYPNSYRIGAYLRAAKALGVAVIVASPGKYSLVTAVAAGIHINLNDPHAVEQLLEVSQTMPFEGVIATDDASVELASQIAHKLGLPGNSPKAAKISRRKDLSRACLLAASVPVPEFLLLNLRQPLQMQLAGLDYPVVIKPVSLSGSRGVIRVDNEADCLRAIARVETMLIGDTSIPEAEKQSLLIEEYISGPELAIEGVLHKGEFQLLAIFDKPESMEGPFFVETYYVTPSRHSRQDQRLAVDSIAQACAAYGLTEGPVHAECRLAEGKAWIMEVASRTIGGECARLLTHGTGQALETLVIEKCLGREVTIETLSSGVGVMMLPITEAGILRRVEGVLAAQRVAGIDEILISYREGYPLLPLPEGGSYLGFIFATAATPAEVEEALRAAYAKLNVVIAPVFQVSSSVAVEV
ncbi:MAG: ATP-grasp domain-containing protein [Gammaproteobacteria bacterium]